MLRLITGALTFFALAALALVVTLTGSWAAGAADPATFRLTPALLDRMEAATAEVRTRPQPSKKEDGDGKDDPESVEDIARKLDADPRMRAALARQKLSSIDYATATLAALHAGMYLATEPGLVQQKRAAAQASFTPAQRENIEVMRSRRKR